MTRKGISYTIFFAVLFIVFYIVVKQWLVKNDAISVVRPFSFVNQDGNRVTEKDMAGKVYVVEYFFTTCTGICPRMNNNMKTVYEEFKAQPDFYILSHTSDPERDSVQKMKKYADSLGVNTAKWIFLTGPKDSLYTAARMSYTIDDPANNMKSVDESFLHTQFWALVNRKGEVKKIYDGLKESEILELKKDIRKML